MKRNLLYIMGVVCMMTSCIEEQNVIEIVPTPGKDVLFSAELGTDAKTRTLYGEDATTAIKVNWVQGDTIAVYGVDCDRKQAVYSVSVDTDATPNGDGQNYATSLEKTGASGVQWGEDGVSDFYAVYPAADAQFNKTDGVISISTSISPTQNYVFNSAIDDDGVWRGTNFGTDARTPSMQNAVMFAYTKDATSVYYKDGTVYTDEDGNTVAKPVDLHFKPFSTVLKFRFEGFTYDFGDAVTNNTVYVQSIIVTAPEGTKLAGDFDITSFDGSGSTATASASTEGKTTSNIVTINTMLPAGGYLPLQTDEKVEFNVFVIPQEYSMAATSPWKVTINANVAGANQSYTYTLIPTDNQSYDITAGQIHKLKVPAYNIATPPTWDPSKWMTQIPTPVYLSELSIPGAWYCMDSGYQNTTDIATLYNAGIRAFNIDCRVTKNPGSVKIGSGYITSKWASDDSDYSNSYLACAGTENVWGYGSYQLTSLGTKVADVVSTICSEAQKHKDEYVVIVFTFAEKPLTNSGDTAFGSVRADYITEQLNTILTSEGIKEFIYTNVTKDTTIDDVLKSGKNVIVKINHSNVDFANSTSPSFSMPAGHMASFASMAMEGYIQTGVTDIISGLTTSTSPYYGYYAKMQTYPIYNGKSTTDLTYYFHQAQKTSSDQTRGTTTYSAVPTLGQRMDAIDDIISKSTEIYDASSHDAWFQLGIGGSIDGSNQAGVSDVLNEYLQGLIETKLAEDPSPVGIVLMNHATDGDGNPIQLVKDIIEMNGKFYLKREGGDVTTGNTTSGGEDEGDTGEW